MEEWSDERMNEKMDEKNHLKDGWTKSRWRWSVHLHTKLRIL